MKTKLFAAALAALTLTTAGAAAAQDYRRGDRDGPRYERDFDRVRATITIRNDGRTFTFSRGDRMFYRLLDRPYNFRPGMTYAYTDRCNRNGCVAFVFDNRNRRPIDRIFAPHVQMRGWAWREARDFDRTYGRFGRFDQDDRRWNHRDERDFRDQRDDRDDDHRDGRRGDRSGLDGARRD